ncbi:unnamed protein product [Didymodactylos carnosus]|uniref:Intradiol ring-cleavage dioxygenases domain-containing protein n=1 Tax=Didymodactylos carnosus TaxID=1234261 RepID=A0A815TAW3_9BILA|nr:unnamed protein product [Didymodactylos carnosus]CAF1502847.1 unnamed protein product [Didymodactylos carnosus]CAF3714422.1 unnamed protein product [Didymodactylos carnosus]CAF4364371.1 unnamed protein product [Didymodactylos carnosus]
MSGTVFGLDTKKPLPFACIDIWQTSPDAIYDYYEPDNKEYPTFTKEINTHGASRNYDYRARLVTDDWGRYEFETMKPVPYYFSPHKIWRCPHIHYYVQSHGYKPLVVQVYFDGEDKNEIG